MKESTSLKIVKCYGAALLTYACIEFVIRALTKYTPVTQHIAVEVFHDFAQLSALTVILSPLNFLVGYGLFRQRKWALYIALTSLAFYPLQPLANWLMWGRNFATVAWLITQACSVSLTFLFLFMQRDRGWWQDDEVVTKRWKGYAVTIFVVLTCLYPVLSIVSMRAFWTWKFHTPFFNPKPQVIQLHQPTNQFRRITLMDVSFMLPNEPTELYFSSLSSDKSALVFFKGVNCGKNWHLMVGNSVALTQLFDEPKYTYYNKLAGIKNRYDATKFMLTNNWNPMAYMPGMVFQFEGNPTLSEFSGNGLKGFIKRWDGNGRNKVTVQIFNDKDLSYRELEFGFDPGALSDSDINDVISSITFLPSPTVNQTAEEIKRGQQLLKQQDLLSAQAEFLNAYFHAPDRPDYLLMYLKTLPDHSEKQVKSLRYRLGEFLEKYPQNQEARSMYARLAIQHPFTSGARK